MSLHTPGLDRTLADYLRSISLREPEILTTLRQETAEHPLSAMQIAPEQAQLLALLVQLLGAKKTLDVGVFLGYSALAIALVLPADGKLVACEINPEYAAIARHYWQQANLLDKIDLQLAPALETLDRLIASGQENTFDFALIDADKRNYELYYERVLQLLRPGGLVAIDNTLWHGRVADPAMQDHRTNRMRAFNQRLHQDERIVMSLIAIGDGMTLGIKLGLPV